MSRITWRFGQFSKDVRSWMRNRGAYGKLCARSLLHNHHLNQSYCADVCMEPIFWVVDNCTHFLGPFFVSCVAVLTAAVVYIAHWIGLPFYWHISPVCTVLLVIFGYWLLLNVVFHYYMAVTTPPGYPPEGVLITEVASICKKCIAPKPPRTHHCSICQRCVLKMDHHCPWLNNCVGHQNHRYFFLYMAYTTLGTLFLILFGVYIAAMAWFKGSGDAWQETEPLVGHSIRFNSSGHIIPITEMNEYGVDGVEAAQHDDLPVPFPFESDAAKYQAIVFMAFINVATFIALGSLTVWHLKLIRKGETSIEAHINASETQRLTALGLQYTNPYDLGTPTNVRLFFGLVSGRTVWRHVVLPSPHRPKHDGLSWPHAGAANATHDA